LNFIENGILYISATEYPEVGDLVQVKHWSAGGSRRLHAEVVCTIDVTEPESRSEIGLFRGDFDIGEFNVPAVTNEVPRSWQRSEHGWFRIGIFFFRWLQARHLPRAAAELVKVYIADLQIFDEVARYSADDRAEFRKRSVAGDIADQDALHAADDSVLRTPHAGSKAKEHRRVGQIAHSNPDKTEVFTQSSIHCFQRQTTTAVEDAIRDSDVLEASVRFRAELNTSGIMVIEFGTKLLEGSIEHSAEFIVACHITVRDRDIFGSSRVAKSK